MRLYWFSDALKIRDPMFHFEEQDWVNQKLSGFATLWLALQQQFYQK